jgi:tyrosyl-tRNA synthetase
MLPTWLQTFPENQDLEKELAVKRRVKIGIDATAPSIHIGHLVPLRIARKLQERGHELTVVLGTTTAMLGDHSGQDKTRPILSREDVLSNASAIGKQINRVLLPEYTVVMNNEFSTAMSVERLLKVASMFTTARMLSRDAFRKRIAEGNPIGLHELMVPILQGWDSVCLKSEVEIGGVDQTFNFDLTRELQALNGVKSEICILTPIIPGIDGRKMSKSLGNTISFDDEPNEVFGKVMSISDDVMNEWFPLFTDMPLGKDSNPRDKKLALAHEITRQVWNVAAAMDAQLHFIDTFVAHKIPENLETIIASDLITAIVGLRRSSKTEARRWLLDGAVHVNEVKVLENQELKDDDVVRVGKRFFCKVKVPPTITPP